MRRLQQPQQESPAAQALDQPSESAALERRGGKRGKRGRAIKCVGEERTRTRDHREGKRGGKDAGNKLAEPSLRSFILSLSFSLSHLIVVQLLT